MGQNRYQTFQTGQSRKRPRMFWDLSSHCKANQEADKKAFVALCKHLKAKTAPTVPSSPFRLKMSRFIGSDRDYGPEAQAEFDSPVPAKLVAAMKKAGCGRIYDIWQQSGAKKSGTWPEIFGCRPVN